MIGWQGGKPFSPQLDDARRKKPKSQRYTAKNSKNTEAICSALMHRTTDQAPSVGSFAALGKPDVIMKRHPPGFQVLFTTECSGPPCRESYCGPLPGALHELRALAALMEHDANDGSKPPGGHGEEDSAAFERGQTSYQCAGAAGQSPRKNNSSLTMRSPSSHGNSQFAVLTSQVLVFILTLFVDVWRKRKTSKLILPRTGIYTPV